MDIYVRAITDKFIEMLLQNGFEPSAANWIGELSMFILLLLFAYLSYMITRRVMQSVFIPLVKRTENQFDDLLIEHKFFNKLSYLVPAWILYALNDDTISLPVFNNTIHTLLESFFVINVIIIVNSIISTLSDLYDRFEYAKDHPLKALFQVIKIVTWLIGALVLVGIVLNRDIDTLIVSLGAVSAILLIVFRDAILGLVGGFQLIFNKMLSIGDWMEMPKFGADGTVMEINLTTVKIQNWDKTIVTIPTYNLVTDSFKNWRGMAESGGRRIKRAIFIDMDSIRFLDDQLLNKLRKINVLSVYLEDKKSELEEYNSEFKTDPTSVVNGRRQTNIGVFRAYVKEYLHNRKDIRDDMTFLIRQLQPTAQGIPIEIYVFTTTIEWLKYESVQSDIFDHILAVIPEFDLRVFQLPNSSGFSKFVEVQNQ